MRIPWKRPTPGEGDGGRQPWWLWRLAADAARTALAVARTLLWLWREGEGPTGHP